MNESFAATARRWNTLAARLLGWRPDDFWSATPAELVMALAEPGEVAANMPPSRELIAQMMEREAQ
jgi:hypothetical protein